MSTGVNNEEDGSIVEGDSIVEGENDSIVEGDNNNTEFTKLDAEKLSQKIERYIKQQKLSEIDQGLIVQYCRMEGDYFTQTKTGIHLNFDKYSSKTLMKIKAYVEQCEENWKDAEQNEQINIMKKRENETVDFFKRRLDEKNEEEQQNDKKKKPQQRPISAENEQNNTAMMINFGVDNKKKPLNEYKGIFQRIMRKSRAIKNYKSIPNNKKKKTTQILTGEKEPEEDVYSIEEEEEIIEEIISVEYEDEYEEEEDVEEVEEVEEENDMYEDDEEEEEEISSIIDEDSDAKYRDTEDDSDFEDRGDLDALGEKYQ